LCQNFSRKEIQKTVKICAKFVLDTTSQWPDWERFHVTYGTEIRVINVAGVVWLFGEREHKGGQK
jgi:hypothetical protein